MPQLQLYIFNFGPIKKYEKSIFLLICVSQVSFITINCPMYSVAIRGKKLSIKCVSFYFINKCNNVLNIIQQYLGEGAWETRSMTFDDHSTRMESCIGTKM